MNPFMTASTDELGPEPEKREHAQPRGLLNLGIKTGYQKTIKKLAQAASGILEARAGAGTGALLMLDDEAQDVAEPAARLLARHAPLPGGTGPATDLSDIIELVVALGGYVINGIARRTSILVRGNLAPTVNPPAPTDNADNAPAAVPSWPSASYPVEVGAGAR